MSQYLLTRCDAHDRPFAARIVNHLVKKLPRYLSLSMSLLMGTGCTFANELTGHYSSAEHEPRVTLQGANGANHCTRPFVSGKYDFEDNTYCKNDKAIGIEFEHVPSASNILLFDDYTCDRGDSGNYFWLYLRTIKEDVTVPPIPLEEIMATPPGSVIRPGVRVMAHYRYRSETANERTSCMLIQVDAQPLD